MRNDDRAATTNRMPRYGSSRRTKVVLLIGVTVFVSILVGRPYLQHQISSWATLNTQTPSTEVIRNVLDSSERPLERLKKYWETGRLPQRLAVMDHLRRNLSTETNLWPDTRPILLEAALTDDTDLQQTALTLLSAQQDRSAIPFTAVMLDDPDPDVRLIWLRHLLTMGGKEHIALIVEMTRDDDPGVAGTAAAAMRRWTGEDFGLRIATLPAQRQTAVEQWAHWWKQHQHEYPPMPGRAANPAVQNNGTISAPDMPMSSIDGTTIRLVDLRGKMVLINFWATWCPPCLAEIPALTELQRRYPDDLVILGVNVDLLHDHDSHSHGHGDDHDQNPPNSPSAADRVRKFVDDNHLGYPIVLDKTGHMTAAYAAGGLPVSAWVDRNGNLVRRTLGPRSLEVFDAIFTHIARSGHAD